MTGRRLIDGKDVVIIVFIMLGIYGTFHMYKYLDAADQNYKGTSIVKTSLSHMPTCDHPKKNFSDL